MALIQRANLTPGVTVSFLHALWLAAVLLLLTGPARAAQFTVSGPGGREKGSDSLSKVASDPDSVARWPTPHSAAVRTSRRQSK